MDEKSHDEYLNKKMTETEEAYHSAYPNVHYPWLSSIFVGIFGKNGRGALLWALVSLIVVVAIWVAYSAWAH